MLNHDNYYTIENDYLTNSKINVFLKDKPTFKKYYIDRKPEFKETPSLVVGKAVDTWVLHNKTKFNKLYDEAVLKKDDAEKFIRQKFGNKKLLAPEMYKKIEQMSENLLETQVIKDIRGGFERDKILTEERKDLDYFSGLAGIPDAFQINSDECILVDLKTSNVIGNKFYWHAKEFGYYRQLAMYTRLIQHNYKQVNSFKYFFVVVQNQEPYHVQLYKVDNKLVKDNIDLIEYYINEINNEKKFKHNPINWGDYITLADEKDDEWVG